MTESVVQESQSPRLTIPSSIQAVIDGFEARSDVFTSMDVSSALKAARTQLDDPTPDENHGAWAEVLAFSLAAGTEHNDKPWGGYFGPMGSGTRDGETFYFPDVRQADSAILDHWKDRARSVKAPVLSARYNDLIWDLSKLIANEKRNVEFARRAIAAYLTSSAQKERDAHDAFPDAERALALAIQIDDRAQRDSARGTLLDLHRKAVSENGMWWKAFDALEEQPKSGLTDTERDGLVADLESVLARCADTSDPSKFNPHDVESAASKLLMLYRRMGKPEEYPRLHLTIAKTFEHFGGMGDAMLASMVLQTSMDAYRAAESETDAHRVLRLIEKANVDSVAQMTRHEHRVEIPPEQVEAFLTQVVLGTKDETFRRISGEFMLRRDEAEKALEETVKTSPLVAMIGRTKLSGNRVVASIGSIDDDPVGRLIDEADTLLGVNTTPLSWSVDRAIKQHSLRAEDFAEFCNRTGLFGDGRLLLEGLSAWIADDHAKAAHILVPQIEAGFRTLLGRGGRPTTKPHPQMKQARMVVTLGEMLTQPETATALGKHGPDIVLHFRALYTDPRGYNFRNELAHGLASFESVHAGIMLWVVHSLILLGAWLKPMSPESEQASERGA